ncbi:MAG: hypothetical protein DMF93_16200, partial [Acidobacteria bacterium]
MPPHVQRAAKNIADYGLRAADRLLIDTEAAFLRAVLAGYPDRVAQRRSPTSADVLLASGTGATIARESGVVGGEFLVALDVRQSPIRSHSALRYPGIRNQSAIRNPQSAMIYLASVVEREWLQPTSSEVVHRFDEASGRVKATAIDRYDALTLAERPVPADPDIAAQLLADAWLARGPRAADEQLLRRLPFAGRDADLPALVRTAARGAKTIEAIDLASALPADVLRDLDREAPEAIVVPSGRRVRLE